MTYEEAKREAARRWGAAAHVECRGLGYVVGTVGGTKLPNGTYPIGYGFTWEAAFADADRRARGGAA